MANTCNIPDGVVAAFRKFKLGKSIENTALIMVINKETLDVEIADTIANTPIDDLQYELPESAPRFIAYSYKYTHDDGRVSYPLVFIFYCPPGINPALNMMYASTKQRLSNALEIMKIFDVRNAEDMTEAWLKDKLGFFK